MLPSRDDLEDDQTLISKFVEDEGGKAVIKPLQGSGGQGVVVITEELGQTVNHMIEATLDCSGAILRDLEHTIRIRECYDKALNHHDISIV